MSCLPVSLDVRAKEGGKETVTRFALASAMRKTKRLRRRLLSTNDTEENDKTIDASLCQPLGDLKLFQEHVTISLRLLSIVV